MNNNVLAGKYISLLGASTSTFNGFSNSTLHNSTIGDNVPYYPKDYLDNVNDMWWMRVINYTNMKLCVNNAWSGSCVTTQKGNESAGCMTRATQLHNDILGIDPDIIVLIIGGNDALKSYNIGPYCNKYDIYDQEIGAYKGDCTLFGQAYATLVHKAKKRYPNADFFLCSMLHWRIGMEPYNAVIKKIASEFGAKYVDFYSQTPISPVTAETYLNTDNVHPTREGHAAMADYFVSVLKDTYK